jgi:hypothetical protein
MDRFGRIGPIFLHNLPLDEYLSSIKELIKIGSPEAETLKVDHFQIGGNQKFAHPEAGLGVRV